MWVARLFALLLPLGIWLIVSSASARPQDSRIAVSGLIALSASILAYFAVGFAFMFGGVGSVSGLPGLSRFVTYFTLPVDNQAWGLIGLRGFFLTGIAESAPFDLFVSYLPLVATASMLVVALFSLRTSYLVQIAVSVLVSGLIFPIVGFWMWGGGWLAAIGTNLNLGHGAVDVGGVTTAALTAGGVCLAWLIVSPRTSVGTAHALPQLRYPLRALSGIVCALVGAASLVAGNPLNAGFAESAVSVLFTNLLVACAVGALVSLGYTGFVVRKPDTLSAARATIAALIAVSAGGVLLPAWTAAILGVIAAILAVFGLFLTNEILHLQDDNGVISSAFLPAIVGLITTGLFSTGVVGRGWNGIGASTYLGVSGLGVVGLIPTGSAASDPGQLTAQIAMVVIVGLFSFAVFVPIAMVLRRVGAIQPALVEAPEPVPQVAYPVPATSPVHIPVASPTRDLAPANSMVAAMSNSVVPNTVELTSKPVMPAAVQESLAPTAKRPQRESLLDRLRRARNPQGPDIPTQARHVAYPVRVGGRRIAFRPLVRQEETPPAAEGSEPAS